MKEKTDHNLLIHTATEIRHSYFCFDGLSHGDTPDPYMDA